MIAFTIGGWVASPQQPPTPARDEVKSAGRLGLWGSILMFIPGINTIGIILIILALRRLSKAYNNDAIWRNALYTIVTSIISIIGGLILLIIIATSLAGSFTIPSSAGKVVAFLILLILYVVILVGGWFMKNAYSELSKPSNVEYFSKVAKWYWISAILTIIAVGLILLIIALIYMILGFRRLKNLQ